MCIKGSDRLYIVVDLRVQYCLVRYFPIISLLSQNTLSGSIALNYYIVEDDS